MAGARYHLAEAQASEALRALLDVVRPYIERRFNWTAGNPAGPAERDTQIALLDLMLDQPGPAPMEFNLAKRLKHRAGPGDLAKALPHARRAAMGQDFSAPWVLWIQIVYLVDGAERAVAAAREAAGYVHPAKNLFAVYQQLGAVLNHSGRDHEAVEVCLEGAERSNSGSSNGGSSARLVEEAMFFAAAMPTTDELVRIQTWARSADGLDPAVALATVLLDERTGNWRAGAEVARLMRRRYPKYFPLALREAFCWLGASEPDEAQAALDSFPEQIRLETRGATAWLAALVALRAGDLPRGRELASRYLDAEVSGPLEAVEAVLLREWDHRVATTGVPNPALNFPALPPCLTGLDHIAVRPQHGGPVLPQHRKAQARMDPKPCRILAVATEWHSGKGGLSTFNRQLCVALAEAGVEVVCLTQRASQDEVNEARLHGVTVIEAARTQGLPDSDMLFRRPRVPDGFVPDYVIGHGRITGPAAAVQVEDHFPQARRLHFVHMAPDEIEWEKVDRADDAGARAETRTQAELDLGRRAHRVVAVGPRLFDRYRRDLSGYADVPAPLRFDPGFDVEADADRIPPPGEPLKILLLGRAEDLQLKGLDLAAAAVGRVAGRLHYTELELVVRGAQPGTTEDLREKLRAFANCPALSIVPRLFSSEEETIQADLRTSSLVLMPSRAEGFGLVGLEAIVAGTPAMINNRSGLAKLLDEHLQQEVYHQVVIEVTGDLEADTETWARGIEGVLRDREASFKRARDLQQHMGGRLTWQTAVNLLLAQSKG